MIEMHRILMATDFSKYSKEALDYAIHLAKVLGANLYLLHVFEPPFSTQAPDAHPVEPPFYKAGPEVSPLIEQIRQEESKRLHTLAEETRHHGIKVHPILKEGKPWLQILKAAEEIPADLIVVGTHGRTGLEYVMVGSVAERLVRMSSCPVFTVRPKALKTALPI